MKSLLLAVVVALASTSFAFAKPSAQNEQIKPDVIRIVRDWK